MKRKSTKKKPPVLTVKSFKHYWICGTCADQKGGTWPEGHCATVTYGVCNYCKGVNQKDLRIIPWVDYNWPGLSTTRMRD